MRAYIGRAGGRPGWLVGRRTGGRASDRVWGEGRGERNEIKTALALAKATGRSRFPQFTTAGVRRARTAVYTPTMHGSGSGVLFLFFPPAAHALARNILSEETRLYLIVARCTVFSIKDVLNEKLSYRQVTKKHHHQHYRTHCHHHSYGLMIKLLWINNIIRINIYENTCNRDIVLLQNVRPRRLNMAGFLVRKLFLYSSRTCPAN